MTLWETYKKAENILKNVYPEDFKSEADSIFKYAFNMNKLDLILNKENEVSESTQQKLFEIVEKRLSHIPLQYILKSWNFMGLDFKVGEGVLIPRDDTSVLVEASLKHLLTKKNFKAADLCSGSGCISITIENILRKRAKDNFEIYAIELSKQAFGYLSENIKFHNSNVKAVNKDIFKACDDFKNCFFDAIISNPPYIKTSDLKFLQKEVQKEPEMALDGGKDGLVFYEKICEKWVPKITFGGFLAFEVGINQSQEVKKIMENAGLNVIDIVKDINNIDRALIGIKNQKII